MTSAMTGVEKRGKEDRRKKEELKGFKRK